jgi:hypothetical protein
MNERDSSLDSLLRGLPYQEKVKRKKQQQSTLKALVEEYFEQLEEAYREKNYSFTETALAEQAHIVGDLPAQTNEAQLAYFTKSVFRTAERSNIQFRKFFLCADYYSAEQFVDSHKALGDNIPHVLVLNEGLCDDFSFLDDYDEFQELYKEHSFPIITLPKIEYRECQAITTYRLSYAEALESEHLTVVGRQRVADLLMDCYEQLDELGLFQNEE